MGFTTGPVEPGLPAVGDPCTAADTVGCDTMRAMTDDVWISAPPARRLDGSEPFAGLDATVLDFWRFAMSDLRMNNLRGYLAEFLVAKAVGATGPRVEWDAYDVLAPDGTRIEVKSSAYMQVWDQRRPSTIRFTGLAGRTWDPRTGESAAATFNADVYVFAVHTARNHDEYDVLDVDQWAFYVLPRKVLEDLGYKSIGLNALDKISAGPVSYAGLTAAIQNVLI